MIRLQHLRKSFGEIRALRDLSFSVAPGEIFGLLGPNGAGKTTTLSIISTLMPADGGSCIVDGLDVSVAPREVRRRIGVVPQELALYEDLSAGENLEFWGRLYGLTGRRLRRRVAELLEAGELTATARRPVKTFSGGMKRRLNLLIGLVHAPRLLLLDEPTVGIDAQARSRILGQVRRMNEEGLTVLYTTHYLEEAEQLCDRIGVIDHGRLVALGDRDELISQVGENDTVRFVLPSRFDDDFSREAGGWPLVDAVARRRGKMELHCPQAGAVLPLLQQYLRSRELELERLEISRPDLESLYLSITGREPRE